MSTNETNVPDRVTQFSAKAGPAIDIEPRRMLQFASASMASDLYCLLETGAVWLCGLAAGHFYLKGVLGLSDYAGVYMWPLLLLPLTMAIILQRTGLYSVQSLSRFAQHSSRAVAGLFGAFFTIALVAVILGVADDYSRMWFGLWLVLATVTMWLMRAIASRTFHRLAKSGAWQKRVAVYGWGSARGRLLEEIGDQNPDLRVIAIFGPDRNQSPDLEIAGDLKDLVDRVRRDPPDTIMIAMPDNALQHLAEVINELSVLPAEIKLFPSFGAGYVPLRGVSAHGSAQFIDLQRKSVSDWGRIAKAIEDYTIAIIGLVALSPVLALAALAIRLESRGPVLFSQDRNGRNNMPFRVLKFRTMRVAEPGEGFVQAKRNDDRVTRVGRFLRRTSLDEVPQLLNVLRGEMSIVGPRPHPIELNRMHVDRLPLYNKRHSVKPGITGWAQVNDHRGPTLTLDDMRKRLECDLYYIDNWSIWLDLSIIAATPLISIIHRNAV